MQIALTADKNSPLVSLLQQASPIAELHLLSSKADASDWFRKKKADILLFDLDLHAFGGMPFAHDIKKAHPRLNLIFVSDTNDGMPEAFRLHASGYLPKPLTAQSIKDELAHLRYPVLAPEQRRISVQTFGNFEVFFDGQPIHFRRKRSKELFAYLIDRRGAGCTMGELISVLWEGTPDTNSLRSQLRSLIADLRSVFRRLDEPTLIIKTRDFIAVNPARLDCDYYRFLAEDTGRFQGEYMKNYSWAEPTTGALEGME